MRCSQPYRAWQSSARPMPGGCSQITQAPHRCTSASARSYSLCMPTVPLNRAHQAIVTSCRRRVCPRSVKASSGACQYIPSVTRRHPASGDRGRRPRAMTRILRTCEAASTIAPSACYRAANMKLLLLTAPHCSTAPPLPLVLSLLRPTLMVICHSLATQ